MKIKCKLKSKGKIIRLLLFKKYIFLTPYSALFYRFGNSSLPVSAINFFRFEEPVMAAPIALHLEFGFV